MSETRELTQESVETRRAESEAGHASTLPRFLFDLDLDLHELSRAVLRWTLENFGFERGFLLKSRPLDREGENEIHVIASQRAVRGPERWTDIARADAAVNRSAVLRALAQEGAIVIDDSLVPPGPSEHPRPETAESHATVLARAFRLSDGSRALLYVDRAAGIERVTEEERALFDAWVDTCAPSIVRAALEIEARELRDLVEDQAIERGDDSDLDDDARIERSAEAGIEGARSEPPPCYHGIIGRDPKLLRIFEVIEKIKDSDLSVCIFGESGTGKELIARAIHEASERRENRFVSENCGAITETLLESELFGHVKGAFTGADEDRKGLFEEAHRGTLFLDEIGDMPESMQRKLLRALQEGTIRPIGSKTSIKVDVRVICASNRDLKHLVREGKFRADLYYRLNVFQIEVPPLRDRRGDIPLLVDWFLEALGTEEGIRKRLSDSARRSLYQYSWPGNVRELRNVLRRVLLTAPRRVIARRDVVPFLESAEAAACLGNNVARDDDHLVLRIPLRRHFNDIIEECERLVLLNALEENGWNKSRVTKVLSIPRQSLYNKIAKYDLQRNWDES
ncbi:MAG TPA: sigma-54 dependent transcriptional regulator [Planctomycetota bacterium]|nr:sigma-54 dependent transcriptional regulator [Planctomycetota bacterium]